MTRRWREIACSGGGPWSDPGGICGLLLAREGGGERREGGPTSWSWRDQQGWFGYQTKIGGSGI